MRNVRRPLALLLILTLCLSLVPAVAADSAFLTRGRLAQGIMDALEVTDYTPPAVTPFTDVPTDHPNYAAISYCTERNILSGYPDGRFAPDLSATRSVAADVLFRAGLSGSPGVTAIGDMEAGEWLLPAAQAAVEGGVMTLDDQGNFQPNTGVRESDILWEQVVANAQPRLQLYIPESPSVPAQDAQGREIRLTPENLSSGQFRTRDEALLDTPAFLLLAVRDHGTYTVVSPDQILLSQGLAKSPFTQALSQEYGIVFQGMYSGEVFSLSRSTAVEQSYWDTSRRDETLSCLWKGSTLSLPFTLCVREDCFYTSPSPKLDNYASSVSAETLREDGIYYVNRTQGLTGVRLCRAHHACRYAGEFLTMAPVSGTEGVWRITADPEVFPGEDVTVQVEYTLDGAVCSGAACALESPVPALRMYWLATGADGLFRMPGPEYRDGTPQIYVQHDNWVMFCLVEGDTVTPVTPETVTLPRTVSNARLPGEDRFADESGNYAMNVAPFLQADGRLSYFETVTYTDPDDPSLTRSLSLRVVPDPASFFSASDGSMDSLLAYVRRWGNTVEGGQFYFVYDLPQVTDALWDTDTPTVSGFHLTGAGADSFTFTRMEDLPDGRYVFRIAPNSRWTGEDVELTVSFTETYTPKEGGETRTLPKTASISILQPRLTVYSSPGGQEEGEPWPLPDFYGDSREEEVHTALGEELVRTFVIEDGGARFPVETGALRTSGGLLLQDISEDTGGVFPLTRLSTDSRFSGYTGTQSVQTVSVPYLGHTLSFPVYVEAETGVYTAPVRDLANVSPVISLTDDTLTGTYYFIPEDPQAVKDVVLSTDTVSDAGDSRYFTQPQETAPGSRIYAVSLRAGLELPGSFRLAISYSLLEDGVWTGPHYAYQRFTYSKDRLFFQPADLSGGEAVPAGEAMDALRLPLEGAPLAGWFYLGEPNPGGENKLTLSSLSYSNGLLLTQPTADDRLIQIAPAASVTAAAKESIHTTAGNGAETVSIPVYIFREPAVTFSFTPGGSALGAADSVLTWDRPTVYATVDTAGWESEQRLELTYPSAATPRWVTATQEDDPSLPAGQSRWRFDVDLRRAQSALTLGLRFNIAIRTGTSGGEDVFDAVDTPVERRFSVDAPKLLYTVLADDGDGWYEVTDTPPSEDGVDVVFQSAQAGGDRFLRFYLEDKTGAVTPALPSALSVAAGEELDGGDLTLSPLSEEEGFRLRDDQDPADAPCFLRLHACRTGQGALRAAPGGARLSVLVRRPQAAFYTALGGPADPLDDTALTQTLLDGSFHGNGGEQTLYFVLDGRATGDSISSPTLQITQGAEYVTLGSEDPVGRDGVVVRALTLSPYAPARFTIQVSALFAVRSAEGKTERRRASVTLEVCKPTLVWREWEQSGGVWQDGGGEVCVSPLILHPSQLRYGAFYLQDGEELQALDPAGLMVQSVRPGVAALTVKHPEGLDAAGPDAAAFTQITVPKATGDYTLTSGLCPMLLRVELPPILFSDSPTDASLEHAILDDRFTVTYEQRVFYLHFLPGAPQIRELRLTAGGEYAAVTYDPQARVAAVRVSDDFFAFDRETCLEISWESNWNGIWTPDSREIRLDCAGMVFRRWVNDGEGWYEAPERSDLTLYPLRETPGAQVFGAFYLVDTVQGGIPVLLSASDTLACVDGEGSAVDGVLFHPVPDACEESFAQAHPEKAASLVRLTLPRRELNATVRYASSGEVYAMPLRVSLDAAGFFPQAAWDTAQVLDTWGASFQASPTQNSFYLVFRGDQGDFRLERLDFTCDDPNWISVQTVTRDRVYKLTLAPGAPTQFQVEASWALRRPNAAGGWSESLTEGSCRALVERPALAFLPWEADQTGAWRVPSEGAPVSSLRVPVNHTVTGCFCFVSGDGSFVPVTPDRLGLGQLALEDIRHEPVVEGVPAAFAQALCRVAVPTGREGAFPVTYDRNGGTYSMDITAALATGALYTAPTPSAQTALAGPFVTGVGDQLYFIVNEERLAGEGLTLTGLQEENGWAELSAVEGKPGVYAVRILPQAPAGQFRLCLTWTEEHHGQNGETDWQQRRREYCTVLRQALVFCEPERDSSGAAVLPQAPQEHWEGELHLAPSAVRQVALLTLDQEENTVLLEDLPALRERIRVEGPFRLLFAGDEDAEHLGLAAPGQEGRFLYVYCTRQTGEWTGSLTYTAPDGTVYDACLRCELPSGSFYTRKPESGELFRDRISTPGIEVSPGQTLWFRLRPDLVPGVSDLILHSDCRSIAGLQNQGDGLYRVTFTTDADALAQAVRLGTQLTIQYSYTDPADPGRHWDGAESLELNIPHDIHWLTATDKHFGDEDRAWCHIYYAHPSGDAPLLLCAFYDENGGFLGTVIQPQPLGWQGDWDASVPTLPGAVSGKFFLLGQDYAPRSPALEVGPR